MQFCSIISWIVARVKALAFTWECQSVKASSIVERVFFNEFKYPSQLV